jgi:hypothetical protein
MNKKIILTWRIALVMLISMTLIVSGYVFANRDRIVTSTVTMEYFIKTVENNNKERNKSFVARSNNDVLYNNFSTMLDNVYHYEGVSNVEIKVKNQELFGDGKYQCYFSNAFEEYTPKCDLENEGRYINYLVDLEVKYEIDDEVETRNERGLVVFAKDMVKGNYFTWKLVRFDRYKVEA